MENWQETAERYVAFLDIMGFKDMVSRKPHDDVLTVMKELSTCVTAIKKHAAGMIEDQPHVVRPAFFSDSILLVSNNDSDESLERIILMSNWLTSECLSMKLPIKGAISLGLQTANFERSIHFGKALIDAYLLQNEVFFYGVVAHHSVESRLQRIIKQEHKNGLALYETPFKKVGKIKHYVLDWTVADEYDEMPAKCIDIVNSLYLTVSGEPRKYVDNTVEFVRSMKPSVSGRVKRCKTRNRRTRKVITNGE